MAKSPTSVPTQELNWEPDTALQPVASKELRVCRAREAVKIELTRPENRNALTTSITKELGNLYRQVAQDTSVSRIYLTGQGPVFCAGMHLGASESTANFTQDKHLAELEEFSGLLSAIENAPQVTIALINGPCYGGGNGLAFANDIRISTRDATFNLTEVRIGLSPCAISPCLAREWGIPLFRSAMLTGRPVTTAQLHGLGAIYDIADDNEQLQGRLLHELESTLRLCAPRASAVCKELAKAAWSSPGGPAQDELIKSRYVEMMAPSDEARYGIGRFRKGFRKVDWAIMEKGTGNRDSHL
ncbi:ClpP/crotonase-like domain-containing protein [Dactylonectria estremocensis]|uniref:ClpP/crotonase-like domain-containing protein n=1 Tax=Dactylonectria estremocensis TaxID=1079267 RepID=A0A9P9EMJ1_9HYPO|nr:ClpP/crotonase-like domain-containing protein [Dactylonectria estremocensis]